MRLYETTFIVNPQTDDATIDRQVQSVVDLITGRGGKIVREDRIGTRRMAYPIAGMIQGYYASFIYEAPTEVLTELERLFKLEDAYIRHLTIIYEGDPAVEREQRDAFARTLEESDERSRERRGFREDRGGYRDRDDRGYRGGRDNRDQDDDRPRRGRHFGGDQSIARQEAAPAPKVPQADKAADAGDKTAESGTGEEL